MVTESDHAGEERAKWGRGERGSFSEICDYAHVFTALDFNVMQFELAAGEAEEGFGGAFVFLQSGADEADDEGAQGVIAVAAEMGNAGVHLVIDVNVGREAHAGWNEAHFGGQMQADIDRAAIARCDGKLRGLDGDAEPVPPLIA